MRPHHQIDGQSSYLLGRLATRRPCRVWFDAGGRLVGIWLAKSGSTYVVGHDPAGCTVVYPTISPHDQWKGHHCVCRANNYDQLTAA